MGYLSDVAYVIRMNQNKLANETDEEYKSKFKQFIMECKSMDSTSRAMREYEDEEMTDNADSMYIDYIACEIKFHYQQLKWYDDYEDVKSHHAVIDHATTWNNDEWEERFDVAFARIGEEEDDIETQYCGTDGYQLLGIHSTIWTD